MKTNRKRYLVLILVALISMIGFAEENKKPTIVKTFEMNEPGILTSSSSGGGITVTTHDKAEVIVQVYVRKNGRVLASSDSDVDEVLELYDLDITKSGSTVIATAKRKMRSSFWNNSNTGIYFKIIVPKEMSCNVSSSGGGVKISGVHGTHNFSSSGGGVTLENTGGNTKAKSSGGSVKAYKHKGNISLNSSGGGVSLEKAKGNVRASSSGGSVKLSEIYGDVDASSSGGGVSVSGNCPYVKAKSSGGSVKVHVDEVSKELYLTSSGGGVSATILNGADLGMNLDLRGGRVNIELNDFSGKSEKSRVYGTMNGGGIPVYMRSSGGGVTVSFED